MTPEQEARKRIDLRFAAAGCAAWSGSAYAGARCGLPRVDRSAMGTRPVGFCSPISKTPFVRVHAVADVGRDG